MVIGKGIFCAHGLLHGWRITLLPYNITYTGLNHCLFISMGLARLSTNSFIWGSGEGSRCYYKENGAFPLQCCRAWPSYQFNLFFIFILDDYCKETAIAKDVGIQAERK